MNKKQPSSKATTFGKIPEDLWSHEKWFIGKVQIPLYSTDAFPTALIYDDTRKWQLYIPLEWVKNIKKLQKDKKAYFWMWFDKDHGIVIEEGTKVKEEQYW